MSAAATAIPASLDAFDKRAFRGALGAFATGVTIVTTLDEAGRPIGVTANSFNSVSLEPPLVLWSLSKNAYSRKVFENAEYWAIHVLSGHQEELSRRFAAAGAEKFQGLELERGFGNVPLIKGCCARLQCRSSMHHDGGDHVILVGEVIEFENADLPPLVFHAGKYASALRREGMERILQQSTGELDSRLGGDLLGYLLFRTYNQFHSELWKALNEKDLSVDEFVVLSALLHRDGQSIAELSSRVAYSSHAQVESPVQLLERKGYLERIEADASRVKLSAAGRELTFKLFFLVQSLEQKCCGTFGEWEVSCLKDFLRQFIARTDRGVPHLWDEITPEPPPESTPTR